MYALAKPEAQAEAGTATAAEEAPRRSPDPWRIAALLPAAAAMGLAVLYGIGALLWAAELSGAGLDVSRTLPLAPLEQVLARGIGVAVVGAAVAPFLLLFALGMGWLDRRRERDAEARDQALAHVDERVQEIQRARRLGQEDLADRLFAELKGEVEQMERTTLKAPTGRMLAALAGLAVLLVSVPWADALVFAALFVALVVWQGTRGRSLPRRPFLAVGLAVAAVIGVLLAATYIDPPPLPRVSVETASGERVRGELVVQTGDGYHVATGERRLVGMPARAVVAARVHQVEHDRDGVVELVTGWELIGW